MLVACAYSPPRAFLLPLMLLLMMVEKNQQVIFLFIPLFLKSLVVVVPTPPMESCMPFPSEVMLPTRPAASRLDVTALSRCHHHPLKAMLHVAAALAPGCGGAGPLPPPVAVAAPEKGLMMKLVLFMSCLPMPLVAICTLPKSFPVRTLLCAYLLMPPLAFGIPSICLTAKLFCTSLAMPPLVATFMLLESSMVEAPLCTNPLILPLVATRELPISSMAKALFCTSLLLLPLAASCTLPNCLMVKTPLGTILLMLPMVSSGALPKKFKMKTLISTCLLMLPLVAPFMLPNRFMGKTLLCTYLLMLPLVALCSLPKSPK
ncbi:unnamed protein product [Prorocentrum cordatum]|uniref:Uncharacterized protein n=1 Tax=Prorocentrum cordatum TaxID=2364126 RepID=A0ABN9UI06_9DINO|nr:unnamed protein product [Polarella glacialis]